MIPMMMTGMMTGMRVTWCTPCDAHPMATRQDTRGRVTLVADAEPMVWCCEPLSRSGSR